MILMNRLKYLILLSLLIPSLVLADSPQRNDVPTTLLGTDLDVGQTYSVDQYGQIKTVVVGGGSGGLSQSVIPVSNAVGLNGSGVLPVIGTLLTTDIVEAASTTTVLNLTAHVARVGDSIAVYGGTAANIRVWSPVCSTTVNSVTLCNALPATPAAADTVRIYRPMPTTGGENAGQYFPFVNIDSSHQDAASTGILKLEDGAHTSGDAGVQMLTVNNAALATSAAAADYQYLGSGTYGNALASIIYDPNISTGFSPVRIEDAAFANGDPVFVAGAQAVSAIVQSVGTTGDVAPPSMDLGNRLVTTNAPAGEMYSNCSASNTGTSDIAIKTAIASNRIYVTSISCFNTATVASSIAFKDGSTQIYAGGIGNSTLNGVAHWQHTLTTPLRLTSNTAFNFAMGTTATATTCCAAGYISTI